MESWQRIVRGRGVGARTECFPLLPLHRIRATSAQSNAELMTLSVHSRLIHSRRTALALLALVFASAVCVALLIARALYARELLYAFLPVNLLLAWIPLVFALAVYALRARGSRHWALL